MLNVFRLGRTKTLLFFILKEKMKSTIHLFTLYIKKYFLYSSNETDHFLRVDYFKMLSKFKQN